MNMITKKVYQDTRGRLHNETTGKFIARPKQKKGSLSPLETVQPYFIKDEEKKNTYNRTGLHLEIGLDDDEIFANIMLVCLGVGIVWRVVSFIF